jgi:hypothetical protein
MPGWLIRDDPEDWEFGAWRKCLLSKVANKINTNGYEKGL